MSTNKRVKLAGGREDDPVTSSDDPQLSGSSEEDASHPDQEVSRDTDDEIANGQRNKSKKTLKRKRRATEPSHFGATLQSLLDTDAPSGLPLSLKPSVVHQKNDAKLEIEARKIIQTERKEREERGRIKDVIGGWGGESERSLRKVAQRGVVKLFNTIQQSQLAAAAAEEEAKASRGTGKPSLPTPSLSRKDNGKRNNYKTNISGEEKQTNRDTFFDMIRSGGIVSKV
ncbi:Rrp15p-domain-containing protein [Lanmaoa asiatica]|nr:Rrp15p-domain-containing protein [Lanmaoa asiatica]